MERMFEDLDEAMEHFGVPGMKWGVRRESPGKIRTAARKAAIAITDDEIRQHKEALSGKGLIGVTAKLDKVTWGRNGRFEGYHNKKISELENSKAQIALGKGTVTTLLFGPQYTRPKKS